MTLAPQKKAVLASAPKPDFLASEHGTTEMGGITIDAAGVTAGADARKVVYAGTAMRRNAGDNKYRPFTNVTDDALALEGRIGLLLRDQDVTDGDALAAILTHGQVFETLTRTGADGAGAAPNAAFKTAAKDITFRPNPGS
jgi:hypothetical protein